MDKILSNKDELNLLVVSDLHTGSNSGMLPPNAVEFDGAIATPIPQNKLQQKLWEDYISDAKMVGKIDVLIDAGDNVEGTQMKIFGRTLKTTNLDSQIDFASDSLQTIIDICKPKYFLGVSGTAYHVANFGNADFAVYSKLQTQNRGIQFFWKDVIEMRIGQLAWQIAHVTPTTENILNSHERITKQNALAMYQGKSEKINVFGRGHCHQFSWSLNYGAINFTAPCQQPTSSFGRSKPRLIMSKPDVGMLLIKQYNDTLMPQPMLHSYKNLV